MPTQNTFHTILTQKGIARNEWGDIITAYFKVIVDLDENRLVQACNSQGLLARSVFVLCPWIYPIDT